MQHLLITVFILQLSYSIQTWLTPNSHLEFDQYCDLLNYPHQQHETVTEDGYGLTLFRIQGKNQTMEQGKPVILMMHGFLDCSDTFIVNEEPLAPAFYFANLGYDIWLANSRGNFYSRNHTKYNPDYDKEFWDFTFEDMGKYDLPAIFQYILNETNVSSINYIGHSQGCMQLLISLSQENTFIKNSLETIVFLGPVAFLEHSQGLFEVFSTTVKLYSLVVFQDHLNDEIMPRTWFITEMASRICGVIPYICQYLIGAISSKTNIELDNERRYETIVGHEPAGSSMKNAQHLLQIYKSGKLEQFDYGTQGNQVHYNNSKPPEYDLSKVNLDKILFVIGSDDPIANMEDLKILQTKLVNVKEMEIFKFEAGHLTYMWGKTIKHLEHIAQYLQQNQRRKKQNL